MRWDCFSYEKVILFHFNDGARKKKCAGEISIVRVVEKRKWNREIEMRKRECVLLESTKSCQVDVKDRKKPTNQFCAKNSISEGCEAFSSNKTLAFNWICKLAWARIHQNANWNFFFAYSKHTQMRLARQFSAFHQWSLMKNYSINMNCIPFDLIFYLCALQSLGNKSSKGIFVLIIPTRMMTMECIWWPDQCVLSAQWATVMHWAWKHFEMIRIDGGEMVRWIRGRPSTIIATLTLTTVPAPAEGSQRERERDTETYICDLHPCLTSSRSTLAQMSIGPFV